MTRTTKQHTKPKKPRMICQYGALDIYIYIYIYSQRVSLSLSLSELWLTMVHLKNLSQLVVQSLMSWLLNSFLFLSSLLLLLLHFSSQTGLHQPLPFSSHAYVSTHEDKAITQVKTSYTGNLFKYLYTMLRFNFLLRYKS